jgi:hypothetical protein
MPEMKEMAKEIATILWPWNRAFGIKGVFANFHSQTMKATMRRMPMMRVESTTPLVQGWVRPPDCRATRLACCQYIETDIQEQNPYKSATPVMLRKAPM